VARQNTIRKDAEKPAAERSGAEKKLAGQALAGLDRLIYEPIRLRIVSALAVSPSMTFNELKKLLDTTDGNLSVHARKLEEAEYIVCSKSFEGRMPKTQYRLTESGRRALEKYLNHMEALIQAIREK
jgi:DNA-binding MarR family transcriptional regulator